jgi:hypothetical protein
MDKNAIRRAVDPVKRWNFADFCRTNVSGEKPNKSVMLCEIERLPLPFDDGTLRFSKPVRTFLSGRV